MLLENPEYAAAFAQAYEVIKSMTCTQEEVNACVAALRNKPATGDLGTVTVTVKDTSVRRRVLSTSIDEEIVFEPLTGLGQLSAAIRGDN